MRQGYLWILLIAICFTGFSYATTRPAASALQFDITGKVTVIDSALIKADKDFTIDWVNAANTLPNKQTITTVENLVTHTTDPSNMSNDDLKARGRLLSKLGAYYTRVQNNPDLGIAKMKMADPLLADKNDKSWNYSNLAYAYKLKYANNHQIADKNNSLNYIRKMTSTNPSAKNPYVAEAYCLTGELYRYDNDGINSEANFNKALAIYKTINKNEVDLYVKAINMVQNTSTPHGSTITKLVDMFNPKSVAHKFCDRML